MTAEQAGWLLDGFKLDGERRLPMGQGEHVEAPGSVAKDPAAQGAHEREPAAAALDPGLQSVHVALNVASSAAAGSVEPLGAEPAGHAEHALEEVAPVAVELVPGGHGEHDAAPGKLHDPAGQTLQSDAPGEEKRPAGHTVQVAAPLDAEKLPPAHGRHAAVPSSGA